MQDSTQNMIAAQPESEHLVCAVDRNTRLRVVLAPGRHNLKQSLTSRSPSHKI